MENISSGQGIANEGGDGKSQSKSKTLADSALVLDPVTETLKDLASDELSERTRISNEDILRELNKLDGLKDNQMSVFTCYNVALFFIEPNGEVKTTTENLTLRIFTVQGDALGTIFLQVGTWILPLFAQLSPCYRSSEGIFMFPDIHSDVEGSAVAVLLREEECKALDEILKDLLGTEEEEEEEGGRARRSTGTDAAVYVSENINRGSSYLSRNLVRASHSISNFMDSATSHVLRKVEPKTISINPQVQNVAQAAVTVSGSAASAVNTTSSGLGHAVAALGRYIAPYMRDFAKDKIPQGAVDFTANTLSGIGNIYSGLEQSAEILVRSISNNAVKIAEHKYGQPVGQVTSDVISTIGNIYLARRNMGILRPKSIAKAVVRSTGKAFLEDRREYLRQQHQQL